MFRDNKYKILLGALAVVAGILTYLGASGQLSLAGQELFAAVAVPAQRVGTAFSGAVGDIWKKYTDIDAVMAENAALEEELNALRAQMADYDTLKAENAQYRVFLRIREEHPTFETVLASVIGRDPAAKYYAFTVDRGEKDGVAVADVVITSAGVVGRVEEVGPNYAKVITILDPSVSVGAMVSRTRDNGLCVGDGALAAQGKCSLTLLPRETGTTQGDLIITTGLGGVFPKGLVIGTVDELRPEAGGKSMDAVLTTAEDIATVKMVFIITGFED